MQWFHNECLRLQVKIQRELPVQLKSIQNLVLKFDFKKLRILRVICPRMLLRQNIQIVFVFRSFWWLSFICAIQVLKTNYWLLGIPCWITFYSRFRPLIAFDWQETFYSWLLVLNLLKTLPLLIKLNLSSQYLHIL